MGINSTNKELFKHFPLKSYCTKNDSKNTFDRYYIIYHTLIMCFIFLFNYSLCYLIIKSHNFLSNSDYLQKKIKEEIIVQFLNVINKEVKNRVFMRDDRASNFAIFPKKLHLFGSSQQL